MCRIATVTRGEMCSGRGVQCKEAVIDQVMVSDRNSSFTWQPHDLKQALVQGYSHQFLV